MEKEISVLKLGVYKTCCNRKEENWENYTTDILQK